MADIECGKYEPPIEGHGRWGCLKCGYSKDSHPVLTDKPAQSDAPSAEEWLGTLGVYAKAKLLTQQNPDAYIFITELLDRYAALRTARWIEECKKIHVAAGGDPSEANAQMALTQVERLAEQVAQLERERDEARTALENARKDFTNVLRSKL